MRDLEHRKQYQKEYYLKNKERLLAYRKKFYEENKEVAIERSVIWAKNNPEARKRNMLKSAYGLSLEKYKEMMHDQEGCCFGCSTPHSELKRGLMVDHCHKTGKIRGLLCERCNSALGMVKDNIKIMRNLIKYLENA